MFRSAPQNEMKKANQYLQSHSKVPLLLAANLESGGDGIVEEGTVYGKQMQIAATNDKNEAYRLGMVSCLEAKSVGCNYSFAPVVDIDMNDHNPITNVRTYGSDKEKVTEFASEYIRAAKENNMAYSIKHFPGDGVDEVDQHILTSVNSLTKEEWDKTYGYVYSQLINEGALTVMVGHIAMPAYQKYFSNNRSNKIIPATLSKELLQDLLRKQLGFNGLIITDATPMVGFCSAMEREKAVPYAIEAGCDMFLFNKDYSEDYQFMLNGYRNGLLSEERLNDALLRILATKASIGLHVPQDNTIGMEIIGCPQHRQYAKSCAQKAITLVKDSQKLLPISAIRTPRVLLQILGECESNERIKKYFTSLMIKRGFHIIPYEKESFDFSQPIRFDSVQEFKDKYDIVIYLGNVENTSNKTTNRINWYTLFGLGNNMPWFVEEVPTLFISLQNPYHLRDVPMIKTYINCYSNHNDIIEAVVEKIVGEDKFIGKSPVDPFLGKDYLKDEY